MRSSFNDVLFSLSFGRLPFFSPEIGLVSRDVDLGFQDDPVVFINDFQGISGGKVRTAHNFLREGDLMLISYMNNSHKLYFLFSDFPST